MATQLLLIDPDGNDWHLDQHTREVGLRGVAEARRVLEEALRRSSERAAA